MERHLTLTTLPRIRQARSEMEKKLEEVNKRLEIFSALNDAYQALIDNLKGVQNVQTQKIEHLQSTIDRLIREKQEQQQQQQIASEPGMFVVHEELVPLIEDTSNGCSVPVKGLLLAGEERGSDGDDDPLVMEEGESCEPVVDRDVINGGQLETEIIYDFVV